MAGISIPRKAVPASSSPSAIAAAAAQQDASSPLLHSPPPSSMQFPPAAAASILPPPPEGYYRDAVPPVADGHGQNPLQQQHPDKYFVDISTSSALPSRAPSAAGMIVAPQPVIEYASADKTAANQPANGKVVVHTDISGLDGYPGAGAGIAAAGAYGGGGDNEAKRRRKRKLWILLGILAVLIVAGVVGGVVGGLKAGKDNAESKSPAEFSAAADVLTPSSANSTPSSSSFTSSSTSTSTSTSPSPSPSLILDKFDDLTQCLTGAKAPTCSDPLCQGINSVDSDAFGTCTWTGRYENCPCRSVCSPADQSGPCNFRDCNGTNDPFGGLGMCNGGEYRGCYCKSICGTRSGSCKGNGCEGVNGACTAGPYRGCACV